MAFATGHVKPRFLCVEQWIARAYPLSDIADIHQKSSELVEDIPALSIFAGIS